MDDNLRLDGGIVAIAMGAMGTAWAMIRMFFNLVKRVENNETDIRALKVAHDEKLDQMRDDIHVLSDRTDKRHDAIEHKLDRLIERAMR
jgi:cytochrome c oxidase assembly protein Cox11